MLSEEWSSLNEYDLHHVIKSCWQDQQTGLLEMKHGEAERSCAWDHGKLVFSNSNQPEDRLPEILIRMGLIDNDQFKTAQETFNPEISVGKNLVECGLITQKELVQGAKEQVKNNFQKCFSMRSCEARFLPGEERLPGLRIPLSVPEGVCSGLMALEDRDWISEVFEEDLSKSLRVNNQSLDLKVEFAERVLPLLDGTRDFNQVSFECDVEEFNLMKFLYVLQFMDALEWGAPELQDQEVKQELSEALPQNEMDDPPEPAKAPEMAETAFIPKVIPEPEPLTEDVDEFDEPDPEFDTDLAYEDTADPELIMPEPEEEIFEEKSKGSLLKSPLLLSGVLVLMASGLLWLFNREPEPLVPDPEPSVEESLALFPEDLPQETKESIQDVPAQEITQVEPHDESPKEILKQNSEKLPTEVRQADTVPLKDASQRELEQFVEHADAEDAEIVDEPVTEMPAPETLRPQNVEPDPQPVVGQDKGPISPVALNLPAYKKEDKRRRPPPKEVPKRQMEIPQGEGAASDSEALQPPPPKPQPIVIEPLPESSKEKGMEENVETSAEKMQNQSNSFFEEPDWERVYQFNQPAWEAGQFPLVAQNWHSALSMAKQGWTIACLLACQSSTLQQVPMFLPERNKVILIPRDFNGKPCYWVCYGVFEDQEAATEAMQQLNKFRQYNPDPLRVVPLIELFPNQ